MISTKIMVLLAIASICMNVFPSLAQDTSQFGTLGVIIGGTFPVSYIAIVNDSNSWYLRFSINENPSYKICWLYVDNQNITQGSGVIAVVPPFSFMFRACYGSICGTYNATVEVYGHTINLTLIVLEGYQGWGTTVANTKAYINALRGFYRANVTHTSIETWIDVGETVYANIVSPHDIIISSQSIAIANQVGMRYQYLFSFVKVSSAYSLVVTTTTATSTKTVLRDTMESLRETTITGVALMVMSILIVAAIYPLIRVTSKVGELGS